MKRNKRGQITLEFAVLIAVIAAALVAMSIYIKRAAQGSLREAADSIGDQYAPKRVMGISSVESETKIRDTSKTMSELEAHIASDRTLDYDFNLNGVENEANVYATESYSRLMDSESTETRNENVWKFGPSLFED
ncbi:hypothetical protein ACFL1K_04265 [Candidatus Omnitrophota bacterium]